MRLSEKPLRFSARRRAASSAGKPARRDRALLARPGPRSARGTRDRCAKPGGRRPASGRRGTHRRRSAGGPDPACAAPRAARSSPRRAAAASRSASRPSMPVSRPRSAFCSDSWKVRPIAITSPTDFICVVRRSFGARELLEREARDLRDDVVDGRLERRRRGAAGDVVAAARRACSRPRAWRRSWRSGSRSPSTPAPRSATRAGSSR